jgi:hypothetical protein
MAARSSATHNRTRPTEHGEVSYSGGGGGGWLPSTVRLVAVRQWGAGGGYPLMVAEHCEMARTLNTACGWYLCVG